MKIRSTPRVAVPRLRLTKTVTCADSLVTADNRALSELGWQHLSQPLVDVRSRAGIESVEQKRSGYPEPQTPRQTTGGRDVAIPRFSWGGTRSSLHRYQSRAGPPSRTCPCRET